MKAFTLFLTIALTLNLGAQHPVSEPTYTHRVKIKDAKKNEVCSIKVYDGKLKVEMNGKSLSTKTNESKRAYKEGESEVAEIKYSDKGFKLKSPDGKLAWKVNYKEGKITIADNEENQDAYEFRTDGKRIKVKRKDQELAQIKFYPDTKKLKVKAPDGSEQYVADSGRLSAVPGVLACEAISLQHQAIIMAELEDAQK